MLLIFGKMGNYISGFPNKSNLVRVCAFCRATENVPVNDFFAKDASLEKTKTYKKPSADWQPKGHRFEPVILHFVNA